MDPIAVPRSQATIYAENFHCTYPSSMWLQGRSSVLKASVLILVQPCLVLQFLGSQAMSHAKSAGKSLIRKIHKPVLTLKTKLYLQLQKLIDLYGPVALHKLLYGTSQKGMRRFRRQYRQPFVFRCPESRGSSSPALSRVFSSSEGLCERCKMKINVTDAYPSRQTTPSSSKEEAQRSMIWEIGMIEASLRRLKANHALMDRTGRVCQKRRLRSSYFRKGFRALHTETLPLGIVKTAKSEQVLLKAVERRNAPEASRGLNFQQHEANSQREKHQGIRSDRNECSVKSQTPNLRKRSGKRDLLEDITHLERVSATVKSRPTVKCQPHRGKASQAHSTRNVDAGQASTSAPRYVAGGLMPEMTAKAKTHARSQYNGFKADEMAHGPLPKYTTHQALGEACDIWMLPVPPNSPMVSSSQLLQSPNPSNLEPFCCSESEETVRKLQPDLLISYFQAESFLIIEQAKFPEFSSDAVFAELDGGSK